MEERIMAIALTLKEYLNRWGVEYEVVEHPYAGSSLEIAEAAHIPGDKIVKPVVTEDYHGYLMVLVPATHQVEFDRLDAMLDRHLDMATEEELAELFVDCDAGAVPALGDAYGMDVVMDDSLTQCEDVYFESGDHASLIHLRGEDFRDLMLEAGHGSISTHV
jgi:Ala-tRNA(Pro) deacylase